MAFAEVSVWEAAMHQPPLELRSWQKADRFWFNLGWMKRPVGLIAACILHVILGFLLFQLSQGIPPANVLQDARAGMKLFSLSENSEKAESADAQEDQSAGGSPAAAKPADRIDRTLPPPTEWSISRIRVPQSAEASPAANPGASTAVATSAPAGASGVTGSSDFDPYAGASPKRPGENRSGINGSYGMAAPSSPTLSGFPSPANNDVREFLIRVLRQRFPDLHGSLQLAIQFDRRGKVSEVLVRQGELPAPVLRWLRGRLKSQEDLLANSARPESVLDLPAISLG